jgi:hypothetical protein
MPTEPAYRTAAGHPVHLHTRHYLPALLRLTPTMIKHDLEAADTVNAKVAVLLTRVVGTMWCFWVFNGIALVSLPSAIQSGNITILIAWVSSNWIQLILLPALMVGQNLQNIAADARTTKMFEDIELVKNDMLTALDRLDTQTSGGLQEVLAAVQSLQRPAG